MPPTRKRHKSGNRGQNFRDYSVGGVEIVRTNEFPNLVQVRLGSRVEIVSTHEPDCERRAVALFSRK
jgi:hypothetical protein